MWSVSQAVSVMCQCLEMEQLLAMSVLFKAENNPLMLLGC